MKMATGHCVLFVLVLAAALSIVVGVQAQAASAESSSSTKPRVSGSISVAEIAPRPEDVSSIDGIIKAFYDVITGPPGQPRQWARDRTLYIPGIRFVSMSVGKGGKPHAEVTTHQEYVDHSNARMVKEGFYEVELHRVTKRFGNIAHVFSAYETRLAKDSPVIGRGVNSIELFWDGTRWWIASAIWDGERQDNPLPKDLLPTD